MKHFVLGDLIDIKHGFAFSGEYIQEEDNGVVLVTPGNFRIGGGFQEDKCKFFSGEIPDEFILNAGDFIVTMTDLSKTIDTLGYSAYVPDSQRVYLHNQRIGLVTLKTNECDRSFLYWLMRSHYYQRSIANTSTGATVHHTSPSKIYAFEFDAPELHVQQRIAAYLSAYDELIGNYQKQIRLLEETAERLYKEWFIDYRFPGHEDVEVIDGMPYGWIKRPISSFGKVVTGKTPSTSISEYYGGSIPFVKIPDMHGVVFPIVTETTLSVEGAGSQSNKYVPKNSIMVSCIATVGLVNIAVERCQTNQQINTLILDNEENLYYVYQSLKRIKELLEGVGSNGATMTNVNKTKFERIELLYPDEELVNKYQSFCTPIFDKIYSLSQCNLRLSEARDRLLPKLMSGEIEV